MSQVKAKRQEKIMELISTHDIETQEQLLQMLQNEGFESTQATVSRDIKEMRIVKELSPMGTYRYTARSQQVQGVFSERLNTIFRQSVVSFDHAQNIVVIHTMPGLANAAGIALDSMKSGVILGTLAGDDTVICIMRDNNAAAAFCDEIHILMSK